MLFSGTHFILDLFVFVVQLNSLHSELATQMADSMVFPLIQFREKDLTGRATISNVLYTHIPIENIQFYSYFIKLKIVMR